MTKREEDIMMKIYENLSTEIAELKKQGTNPTLVTTESDPENWSGPTRKLFNTMNKANLEFYNKLDTMSESIANVSTIMTSDRVPRWLRELSDQNQNLRNYAGKLDDMLVELQNIDPPIDPNAYTFRIEVKNRNLLYIFILTLLLLIASVAVNCHQLLLIIAR